MMCDTPARRPAVATMAALQKQRHMWNRHLEIMTRATARRCDTSAKPAFVLHTLPQVRVTCGRVTCKSYALTYG